MINQQRFFTTIDISSLCAPLLFLSLCESEEEEKW